MRKEVFERIRPMREEEAKLNCAELARRYECDYRTVKRYLESDPGNECRRKQRKSKTDPYEVHHLIPISTYGEERLINPLEELVPVCPNCHAMLHRKNPPYSIEEMKAIIAITKERGCE